MEMKRRSGILMHPTSLPGPAGMGDLGPCARAFLETLAAAGQSLWQILPLGPTGYGDSPYAPLSSFAGNELLISLEFLAAEGLLTQEEIADPGFPSDTVDYGALTAWKIPLLRKAARAFALHKASFRELAYAQFLKREASWLEDYALFRAIKEDYDARPRPAGVGGVWYELWPRPLVERDPSALEAERAARSTEIDIYRTLQFFFAEQWKALRILARSLGIQIIGDLPIFVAADSADVWARPGLFDLDAERRPIEVAGVPPDYFSEGGQLWGNPLYAWEAHKREDFSWWSSRIESALGRHDIVRIDHFRGFESCYAVPAGSPDARNGTWRPCPGRELFEALIQARRAAGKEADLPIIAEDLGFITPEVRQLRDGFGFPGMKILQFAFDAAESGTAFDPDNGFLPHTYGAHSVVYTGTHDNDTVTGWWEQASQQERDYVLRYTGACVPAQATPVSESQGAAAVQRKAPGGVGELFIREALKSVAAWAIVPMQDILGLGAEGRMNTPSTTGGNWRWRMRDGSFDPELQAWMAQLTRMYGRSGGGIRGSL